MNEIPSQCCQRPALGAGLLLAAGLILASCGSEDKSSKAAAAQTAETSAQATSDARPAAAKEESTTDSLAISATPVNVDESLQTADQATKTKDWTKATDALLKLQLTGSIKTDQQSWDYNRRMTVLQSQLIEAADAGDARAKAAMDLLRKSRNH